MSMMISEFKPGRSLLLASTGLSSAVALLAGAQAVQAEGQYGSLSYGMFSGEPPNANDEAGDPDSYELTGGALGFFVDTKIADLGSNLTLGVELAFTSNVEGDPEGNGSQSDSYDIS